MCRAGAWHLPRARATRPRERTNVRPSRSASPFARGRHTACEHKARGKTGRDEEWKRVAEEHEVVDDYRGDPAAKSRAEIMFCYPGVSAIARIPMGHGMVGQALIKQYLDTGVQTLLVPMVDTPEGPGLEANHGPAFWAHVERLVGPAKPHRAWLRTHGARLHAFGR